MTPSAHLLRTLAAVAPGARVVDLACGDGRHVVPLAQLGFDVVGVTAAPEAALARLAEVRGDARQRVVTESGAIGDASADWGVLAFDDAPDPGPLAEACRILRPGGWVWVEVGEGATEALAAASREAGLVEAERPSAEDGRAHAIYRRPSDVA